MAITIFDISEIYSIIFNFILIFQKTRQQGLAKSDAFEKFRDRGYANQAKDKLDNTLIHEIKKYQRFWSRLHPADYIDKTFESGTYQILFNGLAELLHKTAGTKNIKIEPSEIKDVLDAMTSVNWNKAINHMDKFLNKVATCLSNELGILRYTPEPL